jgi:hypothetical protein
LSTINFNTRPKKIRHAIIINKVFNIKGITILL